jgi:hypothetical protein
MMKYAVRLLLVLVFASVHSWNLVPAQATRIQLVNLEKMVTKADRIFIGVCSTVEDSTLSGTDMPVTSYTFSVTEPIKGEMDDTLTIRQLGVREPRVQGDKALVFRVPGMPVYQAGQEVVLFLISDSSLGLTSPVGLSQGAFTVDKRDGQKLLQNGIQNLGLFKDLSADVSIRKWKLSNNEANLFSVKKGPIDLETFTALVKKMMIQP